MTKERLEQIKMWAEKRGYAQEGLPEYSEIWQMADDNIKMKEALEWMVANQHLTIMIEEPEQVEHFMSRARAALEGKE